MADSAQPPKPQGNKSGVHFVKSYVNKHTKKVMRPEDYGYKAWPFGGKRKPK